MGNRRTLARFRLRRSADRPHIHSKVKKSCAAHGYPEDVIYAIKSHADYLPDCPRVNPMDKALYACDELAGFITAVALMRPTGIEDLTVASVKKKLKRKEFARNVKREDIDRGAQDFGVELSEHIQFVIDAMKPLAANSGFKVAELCPRMCKGTTFLARATPNLSSYAFPGQNTPFCWTVRANLETNPPAPTGFCMNSGQP